MTFTYKYPMQSVTTDAVIFSVKNSIIRNLLIRRKSDPFKDKLALPGGHIDPNESLANCCLRELREETTLKLEEDMIIEVGAYGDPGRDPRGHYVTIAYTGIIPYSIMENAHPEDDASEIIIQKVQSNEDLAFDHAKIINDALTKLEIFAKTRQFDFLSKNRYGFSPENSFTARQAREMLEIFGNSQIDPGNFTKTIKNWVSMGLLQEIGESKVGKYKGALYGFV